MDIEGGTFVSVTGGTFETAMPGTFVSAAGGTFETVMPGTFHSATGGTFETVLGGTIKPLPSVMADLSFLFSGNYNDDTSDYDGVRYYGSNFRIESNVDKIKERTKKLK